MSIRRVKMSNTQEQTNPTPSTPDTWYSRTDAAAVMLGISHEEILCALQELGVTEQPAGIEMLSDEEVVPFGDLRHVFCDDRKIPIAKARMAMKYLRGPKDSAKTDTISPEMIKMKEKYGIKPKLEDISSDSLLEDYNPNRSDHPVTIVLKKRFGNKPVIVFKPDSTEVDIEATANYIADLDQGFPEEDTVESQGELVRIYKVGDVPNKVIKEDPLFVGSPLKRERSIVNRVNWTNVSNEARQFVRIAVEIGEIDPNDRVDVRDIVNMANDSVENGLTSLKQDFPEVYLEYKERKKLNNLPNLTMAMKEAEARKSAHNNPFGINRSH